MGKTPRFTLVVLPAAKADLDALRAFEARRVADAIDANLPFHPHRGSRKQKSLGDIKAGFGYDPPLWQLKVGEIRVFYNASEESRVVFIRAIRRKPPEMTTEEVLK